MESGDKAPPPQKPDIQTHSAADNAFSSIDITNIMKKNKDTLKTRFYPKTWWPAAAAAMASVVAAVDAPPGAQK